MNPVYSNYTCVVAHLEHEKPPGRILALDVGSRTIGLAVTDPLGYTAQGLLTIRRKNKRTDLAALAEVIANYGVVELVVGLPLRMSGAEGRQSEKMREFVAVLEQNFELPIHLWDERLTSVEANRVLRETDMSIKKRAAVVDQLAAVLILQNWMEARQSSAGALRRNRRSQAAVSWWYACADPSLEMTTLLDQPETPIFPEERTRLVHRVIFGLAIVAAAMFGALAGLLFVYSTDLPQVTDLERYRPSSITELYDQNGNVIGTFALQRRVIARYEDYPKVLRDAVISIEDKDFERHWGVDLWRIMGAAYRDLASGSRAQGASTLTMQLSRNLFLTPDRKFGRKVQEIMLAIQIERRFTKEQIFTLYANQIFLGHGVYGFEAGSEFYFSKPAKAADD